MWSFHLRFARAQTSTWDSILRTYREEKTWSVHSTVMNWHPRLRLGCQFTYTTCGLANFSLEVRILYFSSYQGRKYHIRVFEPKAKVVLSARVWWNSILHNKGGKELASPEHMFATLTWKIIFTHLYRNVQFCTRRWFL